MNIQKTPESLVYDYFNFWNNQDLNGLRGIMADNITLSDWEISATGIEDVVSANENIFNNVSNIHANILSLTIGERKIIAELIIDVEEAGENGKINSISLPVIDVIQFNNSESKIKSIRAYRQF